MLVVLLLPLLAALAAPVDDWGKGPARWLMTKDEQRAWSKLQSDQEASDFIDLFWARRDPTPGTEQNEFKDEFERRVRAADDAFEAEKVRGALTDPGRAFVVLGVPRNVVDTPAAMTRVGRMGARIVFDYPDAELHRLGLDRAPVFSQNADGEFKIDPQQSNAFGAIAKAAANALLRPDLTITPEWALHGGIDAKPQPQPVVVTAAFEEPPPPAQLPPGPHGASRLVFVRDLTNEVRPRADTDPFVSATPATRFSSAEQFGYAFQLCRDGAPDAAVKVGFAISGTSAGKKVRVVSKPQDVTPEPIRVMSTCSVVWASLPLTALKPGSYRLAIEVTDPATKESWNLGGDFEVR
ncbi:MAG TPA: GWxTD domain-containing protein [Thermoanaerobaculia bacterium]|nr:GWxTD domain-containing protein [Thermoanaerobaculia bacterium]